jgi:HlyD family secretion protein
MKLSVRNLALIVFCLAVVGVIVYAFLPSAVEVEVASVTRGSFLVTVDHEGKTRIKERYVVSSPLAGRLLRVDLHPGDSVEAGKTLLTAIEPTDPALLDVRARAVAEARVKSAEASRNRADANLARTREAHELADHIFSRAKELFAKNGVSSEDLETAEHRQAMAREDLRSAQFAVQIAEFELAQAQAALLRTQPEKGTNAETWRFEIRSPINGQVLRVFQESATVAAPGMRLVELGNPADLECEIDVLSSDAVKVAPGAKVLVEHWGGDQTLLGRVRVVEPAGFTKISALGVEEQRVWVIADFVDPLEKRKLLGDGYRVEARIVIWEGNNVLKAPAGAFFRYRDGWATFKAVKNRAILCPVRVGRSNGIETEILEGLDEDDLIIVHPGDRISNGVAVTGRRAFDRWGLRSSSVSKGNTCLAVRGRSCSHFLKPFFIPRIFLGIRNWHSSLLVHWPGTMRHASSFST